MANNICEFTRKTNISLNRVLWHELFTMMVNKNIKTSLGYHQKFINEVILESKRYVLAMLFLVQQRRTYKTSGANSLVDKLIVETHITVALHQGNND